MGGWKISQLLRVKVGYTVDIHFYHLETPTDTHIQSLWIIQIQMQNSAIMLLLTVIMCFRFVLQGLYLDWWPRQEAEMLCPTLLWLCHVLHSGSTDWWGCVPHKSRYKVYMYTLGLRDIKQFYQYKYHNSMVFESDRNFKSASQTVQSEP